MNTRVVVAMSGGVDSSVTAALLHEAGYDVVGVTLRLWTEQSTDVYISPNHRACCSIEEVDDARRVCNLLGVPHYVLNFEREFRKYVVDYFVREYQQGRTPIPCLACNQYLKFHFLLDRAAALGATHVATGHYAQVAATGERFRLLKGADPSKDQSYVLYTLGQADLRRILLPMGGMPKTEARARAERFRLPVARKPDSQNICFVPDNDYRRFLRDEGVEEQPGELVTTGGAVVGTHRGVPFYTVGQRHGLGIATGEPMYVTSIDAARNRIVVGSQDELLTAGLRAADLSFVSGEPLPPGTPVQVRTRYRSPEAAARVWVEGDTATVRFDEPQRAVTPGQSAVFYQGDEVLGGGVIVAPLTD